MAISKCRGNGFLIPLAAKNLSGRPASQSGRRKGYRLMSSRVQIEAPAWW